MFMEPDGGARARMALRRPPQAGFWRPGSRASGRPCVYDVQKAWASFTALACCAPLGVLGPPRRPGLLPWFTLHVQVAAMSSQLVWELVKKHNAFLRKSVNHTMLSAEPGNL